VWKKKRGGLPAGGEKGSSESGGRRGGGDRGGLTFLRFGGEEEGGENLPSVLGKKGTQHGMSCVSKPPIEKKKGSIPLSTREKKNGAGKRFNHHPGGGKVHFYLAEKQEAMPSPSAKRKKGG